MKIKVQFEGKVIDVNGGFYEGHLTFQSLKRKQPFSGEVVDYVKNEDGIYEGDVIIFEGFLHDETIIKKVANGEESVYHTPVNEPNCEGQVEESEEELEEDHESEYHVETTDSFNESHKVQ